MNKNMTLLLSFVVLSIIALVVITMASSGLSDFEGSAEDVKGQGCDYQKDRAAAAQVEGGGYDERPKEYEAMNRKCKEDGEFEQKLENIGVIMDLNNRVQ